MDEPVDSMSVEGGRHCEDEDIREAIDDHFDDVALPDIFEMVCLKQIDFLKEESCDSENDDAEDSPDIFVFLGLVKNLKKKAFIRLYSCWELTFLDEQRVFHV